MNKSVNPVIHLNNVRLSFPQLFEPKAGDEPGAKPKYAATFLLHKKKNADAIAAITAGIEQVKKTAEVLKGKKINRSPLRDGSEKDLDGYTSDVMFISARNHIRPGVVDRKLVTVTEADAQKRNLFSAGCYVNATVEVYGYTHPKSGPGITFSLRNVQFVADGEAFGAKHAAPEEDFKALPDEDEGGVV